MVCLGNICRSPLAHGILESKLPSDRFYIDSAGTADYHIGESPDKRAISTAKLHAIDISLQTARQFRVTDFDSFDIIYCMDQSNFETVIQLARNTIDIQKLKLILEENDAIQNKNVPDPYYGSSDDFNRVFNLLNNTCELIARRLH